MRRYRGIPLPTGVCVTVASSKGKRHGPVVMAYIGGRASRGRPRNQITRRFNPRRYSSLRACIKSASYWREQAVKLHRKLHR